MFLISHTATLTEIFLSEMVLELVISLSFNLMNIKTKETVLMRPLVYLAFQPYIKQPFDEWLRWFSKGIRSQLCPMLVRDWTNEVVHLSILFGTGRSMVSLTEIVLVE